MYVSLRQGVIPKHFIFCAEINQSRLHIAKTVFILHLVIHPSFTCDKYSPRTHPFGYTAPNSQGTHGIVLDGIEVLYDLLKFEPATSHKRLAKSEESSISLFIMSKLKAHRLLVFTFSDIFV